MFLRFIFVCCALHPLLHVIARRQSLQRFIVEEGAKPAIFGSYSYDPVKQEFVPPPSEYSDEGKHYLGASPSLALPPGIGRSPNSLNDTRRPIFWKHVTVSLAPVSAREVTNSVPITNWWNKPQSSITNPKNITVNKT